LRSAVQAASVIIRPERYSASGRFSFAWFFYQAKLSLVNS